MTWDGLKWLKDQTVEPDAIAHDEKPIACPSCGSVLPAFSLCLLRSWVIRDGALVGIVTGERVACQAVGCGHQYSLGPSGTFKHNPLALPMTATRVDAAYTGSEPEPPWETPRSSPPPRKRPAP